MKKIQLIACFLALSSLISCSSCPDQYGDDDGIEKMYFNLRWQPRPDVWQPIIGAFGYIPTDSAKLYDNNHVIISDFSTKEGGQSSFTIIDSSTPRGEDIFNTYFLYLSYEDTDTMRVEFKLKKGECKNILEYGKFFYNNNLINENENTSFNLGGTIIK